MFDYDKFVLLHGRLMATNIPETVNLVNKIHKVLIKAESDTGIKFLTEQQHKDHDTLIEHFKAAGGILKDS